MKISTQNIYLKKIYNLTFILLLITLYFVVLAPLQQMKVFILPFTFIISLIMILYNGYIAKLRYYQLSWLLTIFPVCFSLFYTTSFSNSLVFILIYLVSILIFVTYSILDINLKLLMKVNLFLSSIIVITTLISKFLPEIYNKFLFPLMTQGAQSATIYFERIGVYSGISGQTGTNAFLISIGLGILLFQRKKNIYSLFFIFSFIYALVLTEKRGIILADILGVIIVYLLFFNFKTFSKKLIIITIMSLIICSMIISNIEIIIDFFGITSQKDITSGRLGLYMTALSLFYERPIFGWGINAFVDNPIYKTSVDVHNIYLQLLAELGLFGFVLYMGAIVLTLILTLLLSKKNYNAENDSIKSFLYTSAFVQLVFIFYGVTGNPLYDYNFFLLYLIFIAPLANLGYYRYK
ncbi:O-antigen ligase family protein [Ureibacillus sp. FSL K6-3587]|uniref:O-antigen ligase family protein n=1 Tax=Ureibacillus sp. FSL K6-3587 TaxID=2954681 RepID=UPI0031580712